jgi:transcriptional regulator with XRE-family HTH domain
MTISLAQLIREARLRIGDMTQRDLSKLIGTSLENITAIENGRNHQPSPTVIRGLSRALDLTMPDIYAAITGTMNTLPWERTGDIDLEDAELELMFHQIDSLPDKEARDRVKAFIRFTVDEDRRKRLGKEKEYK